jgi:hypothetical protein
MEIGAARQLAGQVEKGAAAIDLLRARIERANAEERAYREVAAAAPAGWSVLRQTLGSVEAVNPDTANMIRESAISLPLLWQLVEHGGHTWILNRPVWALTNEEILSAPAYIETFRRVVARRQCPDRPELWAAIAAADEDTRS